MKTLLTPCVLGLLLFAAVPGEARAAEAGGSGPRQNLWVELRWVDSALSGAALAGVREGSVVVGTAGSVSARGSVGFNTQRRDAEQQVQRLLVLNGQQASVYLTETTPVQWLDLAVPFNAGAGAGGATPLPSGGAAGHANPGWALPRNGVIEQTQGFTVTPHWPGGQQPVRVELRAQGSGGSGGSGGGGNAQASQMQAQVVSTVSVGLGQWLTVARSGATTQRQERGVISSRSAETQSTRELQLRVDLAP